MDGISVPKVNPIPKGVKNPIEWRFHLARLIECFESKGDAPDWLVDAFYDATFDPVVQELLGKYLGVAQ